MAHVQKKTYISKKTGRRSTTWQARFFAPDGRQHAKRFARRVDAEVWLCENGAAISKGAWIDPSAGRVTFEVYAETWRSSQVHRPTTAEQVRINMTRHIVPAFKGRPIASIRTTEVQSWVKRLSEKLEPSTVEVVYRYFASICRSAVNDRLIAFNPCEGVRLPKKEHRRVVPLETAEVRALIDAMPQRYRAAAVVAAGAGLRQGEVFGLTVDRIDFPRRTLTVDRQLLTISQRPPYLGPPKTAAGSRTIPISETVLFALSEHIASFQPGSDGFLFTMADGAPVPRNRAAEAFRVARKQAQVRQDATWHDLRHFYASLLIRHGESVKTVQARLGHASAVETLDTYAHLWPDSEDRTRQAIEAELGASAAPEARAQ